MTRQGKALALIGFLSITSGALLHWKEFIIIGSVVFGIIFQSFIYTFWLPKSELVTLQSSYAGERLKKHHVTFKVSSPRKKGLYVRLVDIDSTICFYKIPNVNGLRNIQKGFSSETRGEFHLTGIRLICSDLMGVFERTLCEIDNIPITITPIFRTIPKNLLHVNTHTMGEDLATGAGTEISEIIREYVDGSDSRLIHWKTSARIGSLMTRQLMRLNDPTFAIVIDNASEIYSSEYSLLDKANFHDFEDVMDVSVSLAKSMLTIGQSAKILFPGINRSEISSQKSLQSVIKVSLLPKPYYISASELSEFSKLLTINNYNEIVVVTADPQSNFTKSVKSRHKKVYVLDSHLITD